MNTENIKPNEIQCNKSDMSVTFYILLDNRIAVAEMSFMSPDMAENYLEMAKEENLNNFNESFELMKQSERVLFFNRLNVPDAMRELGYGKKLLNAVIEFCKENNYFLINTASNYGNMGQKKLIEFYENAGMKLIHSEGLLYYQKQLNIKETSLKSIKKSK